MTSTSAPHLASEHPGLGSVRLLRRLLQRYQRFLELTVLRPAPEARWATPNVQDLDLPGLRLRKFATPAGASVGGDQLPTLVVTPQVNSSYICDYAPGQSLVQVLLDEPGGPVYATDWKSATPARAEESLDDALGYIARCVEHLGGQARLVGLCQGGWMSLIHSALHPDQVAGLVLAAAPVDFHADPGPVNLMARAMPMHLYRTMVAMGGGVMRGELISTGFDNLLPFERYLGKYLDLWRRLDDPDQVDRFDRLQEWYSLHQHIPGATYLRIVDELFKQNLLVKGRLRCFGRFVELGRVRAPLVLLAGSRDHITRRGQLFAAAELVSSRVVRQHTVDAGHIGVFMGAGPLRTAWPQLIRDLLRDGES